MEKAGKPQTQKTTEERKHRYIVELLARVVKTSWTANPHVYQTLCSDMGRAKAIFKAFKDQSKPKSDKLAAISEYKYLNQEKLSINDFIIKAHWVD